MGWFVAAESSLEPEIRERAATVKGVFLDVDGVLTDGRIVIDGSGNETKFFHVRDGLGIRKMMLAGIKVALITGRSSSAVAAWAGELGIVEVHQGVRDKETVFEMILEKWKISPAEAAFVADDIPDLPVFKRVGLAVAVNDASADILESAHLVTKSKGGSGAVREVAELILKEQGAWNVEAR
jgi:3-deoxy-D-manno-octulosonate 8-phosphate phosphatase (KDO 8-P phosphatase)